MNIRNAITLSESKNIAADLDEEELQKIATSVLETAERDKQSMKEWMDCVDEGLKLCKPEFIPKSEPFDGASNYKSSLLLSAANDFGNRFTMEVMRDRKLAKAEALGSSTIKAVIEKKASENSQLKKQIDAIQEQLRALEQTGEQPGEEITKLLEEITKKYQENTEKIKAKRLEMRRRHHRCDRVTEAMNHNINYKMKSWRDDHGDMMYRLPLVGTEFKKTDYDETRGCSESHMICYPDFIVNQKTISMDKCQQFVHIITVDKSTAESRMKSGAWLDLPLYAEDAEGNEGSDEKSETEKTEDNPDAFYEAYRWLDIDDDGIDEPYIVTLHKSSAQIVRIVARYGLDEIIVRFEDSKPMPLIQAQRQLAKRIAADIEEFGADIPMPDPEDLSPYEVVRIDAQAIITKYGFMPSLDKTFLDIGFFHLIGPEVMGVNKTSNDLMNSGTLYNLQMGFTAKGFRKGAGPIKMKQGEFTGTEIPPEQFRDSIMMNPFKEPSAVLYQLRNDMINSAMSFTSNADPASMITANTAPTTTLAIVQEAMMQHSAHVARIIRSMSHEMRIIAVLLRDYLDEDEYREILGDDEASVKDDFNGDGLHVVCGANPEMSSRTQRMTLALAEMEQVPMVIQAGGNPVPIIKNFFNRIGSENTDEIFPNEAEMSPEEKQQMDMMRQQQEQANAMAEQQVKLIALQTELLQKGETRKDFEAETQAKKIAAEMDKMYEEMLKIKAETILALEKAESEEVKNAISIYTARNESITQAEEALKQPEVVE